MSRLPITKTPKVYVGGAFTFLYPYTGSGAQLDRTNALPHSPFPRVGGTIQTVAPDGSGGWYIGGTFTSVGSVNLNPTGINSSSTYTFSFTLSQLGLTPGPGATFGLFGTYISNSGYRSDEAIAGNDVGAQGWNPFQQTALATYTIVPEPTTIGLLLLGCAGLLPRRRTR